jgi:outer membrane receptor for monomeric catechols
VEEIPHSSADGTNITDSNMVTGKGGQAKNLSHHTYFFKTTLNFKKQENIPNTNTTNLKYLKEFFYSEY